MNIKFRAVGPSGVASSLALSADCNSLTLGQQSNDMTVSNRRPTRTRRIEETLRSGEGEAGDAERIACLEAIIAGLLEKKRTDAYDAPAIHESRACGLIAPHLPGSGGGTHAIESNLCDFLEQFNLMAWTLVLGKMRVRVAGSDVGALCVARLRLLWGSVVGAILQFA